MKLTEKDKQFLEHLRRLTESNDLWVDLKSGSPSYMVLRGTYGEKIHQTFRMTRQGVRWRFWRLFNDVYVSAFESILFVELAFGSQLRESAIRISKERFAIRQDTRRAVFQGADELVGQPRCSDRAEIPGGGDENGRNHED